MTRYARGEYALAFVLIDIERAVRRWWRRQKWRKALG